MNQHKQSRKQLAKQISQTLRPMGVYQIQNTINGKRLIGSSLYLDTIWNRHLFQLRMGGQHVNKELVQDWKTYGEDAFTFEILEQIKPKDEICTNPEDMTAYKQEIEVLEELWIEKLQPYGDQGYHKAPRT